jgi:c-di-GMP-binding flagellar brake protein YcgR
MVSNTEWGGTVMSGEKRVHPRFTISQFISVSYDGESFMRVTAEDISQGGMSCSSLEPVDPMTGVFLMLSIPTRGGDHILKTEGKVLHCQKKDGRYLLGVKFQDLFESDKQALTEYLSLLAEG